MIDCLLIRCAFYGDLYPNDECYDETVAHGLRKILRCRRSAAFVADTVDHWSDKNCIGWTRGKEQKCAVLISNAEE